MIKKILTSAITVLALQYASIATAGCGVSTTYYDDYYIGKQTANGEIFSQRRYTAASNYYRLGSYVTVTYKGRSIEVKINDRIGYGSELDLTKAAFRALTGGSLDRGRITTCTYR